jgi:hypothetical protein
VQPALGVRDHGHGVTGATHGVAGVFEGVDQRLYLGFVGDGHFHIGADGETHITVAEFIDDVAQQVDFVRAKLALGADTHGPHFVAAFGNMMQNAGTWAVVISPVAVVFDVGRVHVLECVWHTTFSWKARLFAHLLSPIKIYVDSLLFTLGR